MVEVELSCGGLSTASLGSQVVAGGGDSINRLLEPTPLLQRCRRIGNAESSEMGNFIRGDDPDVLRYKCIPVIECETDEVVSDHIFADIERPPGIFGFVLGLTTRALDIDFISSTTYKIKPWCIQRSPVNLIECCHKNPLSDMHSEILRTRWIRIVRVIYPASPIYNFPEAAKW